jgi:hypothetical protein
MIQTIYIGINRCYQVFDGFIYFSIKVKSTYPLPKTHPGLLIKVLCSVCIFVLISKLENIKLKQNSTDKTSTAAVKFTVGLNENYKNFNAGDGKGPQTRSSSVYK